MQGVTSTPLVIGDRLWYVSNRAEVVCLDTEGFRDGENDGLVQDEESEDQTEADVIWKFNLMGKLGVSPFHISGCSPATDGKRLFVLTNNGAHPHLPNRLNGRDREPEFVCLDLTSGKLLWSADASYPCVDCQWHGPACGVLGGVPQAIFPGGDGWLYSFAPEGDGRRKQQVAVEVRLQSERMPPIKLGGRGRKNHYVTTPVIWKDKVYVATGRNPEQGEGDADLWCIDPTNANRRSPMSARTWLIDAEGNSVPMRHGIAVDIERGERVIPNPNSAVVWHFDRSRTKREW